MWETESADAINLIQVITVFQSSEVSRPMAE